MPSNARATSLTRRGILAAGGALGLGAVLAACGDGDKTKDSGASSSASAKSGSWEFKDDRGQTVKTKTVPKNIVAFTGMAAALKDFGVEVTGVFGPTYVEDPKTKERKPDVQAGDLDIAKVKVIGNVWGEFNIEEYLKLQPEVLITDMGRRTPSGTCRRSRRPRSSRSPPASPCGPPASRCRPSSSATPTWRPRSAPT